MTLDLAAIRARCDQATPGPWEVATDSARFGLNGPGNAAFIAHARSDVPALLAEVERLRAREGEAAALLERLGHIADTVEVGLAETRRMYAERGVVLDAETEERLHGDATPYIISSDRRAALLTYGDLRAARGWLSGRPTEPKET